MNEKKTPRIRFKGFTDDWEQRKLADVAEIIGGGTPSTSNPDYWDGDIDWYAPAEIGEQIFAYGSVRKITKEGLIHSSAKILPAHKTVLFTSRAGIGNMAILKRPAATNQGFQSLVCHDDIDPYFMFSMGNSIKAKAERVAAGSTFAEISGKKLGELEFMFPDTGEQKAIGVYFKNLDHLITLHQRKYEKLQIIKKSMLENCFPKNGEKVPKIRFPSFTGYWEQRKLRDISSLITKGTTPLDKSGAGDVNFIKVENLDSNSGEVISGSKISMDEHEGYLKRSQLKAGDILFSIAGTLGRVGIIKSSILPANTNQALAIIRTKEGNINYISTVLRGRAVTDFIHRNPTVGAQPNLSLEQVGDLEIPYPSLDEQKKIGDYFKRLDHLITLHQSELEKLQKMKKSLLERMFV